MSASDPGFDAGDRIQRRLRTIISPPGKSTFKGRYFIEASTSCDVDYDTLVGSKPGRFHRQDRRVSAQSRPPFRCRVRRRFAEITAVEDTAGGALNGHESAAQHARGDETHGRLGTAQLDRTHPAPTSLGCRRRRYHRRISGRVLAHCWRVASLERRPSRRLPCRSFQSSYAVPGDGCTFLSTPTQMLESKQLTEGRLPWILGQGQYLLAKF